MAQVAQGGTVRLYGTYRDGTGALTNPVTPEVDILNPQGGAVVTNATPVNESLGVYYYDFTAASDAEVSDDWVARWSGVIGGSTIQGEETFEVVAIGSILPGQGDGLITLAQLKHILGVDLSNTDHDAHYEGVIAAATEAINNFTGRDFTNDPVTDETRTYRYDGRGILDIDDCASITSVTIGGMALSESAFVGVRVTPRQPITYLELPIYATDFSGEMGFRRNLDTWVRRNRVNFTYQVDIHGDWGFTPVPADVAQAAIWTAEAMADAPEDSEGGNVQSKSIAEYSVTWANTDRNRSEPTNGIPTRAQRLLEPYIRMGL